MREMAIAAVESLGFVATGVDGSRAAAVAERVGGRVVSRIEALAADLVATVTPGREVVFERDSIRRGQHVSLMGADGPGKAEIANEELARVHAFCDDWEQASHNGDLGHAVDAGLVSREDVTELGSVLAGDAPGRQDDSDVTLFDSTGLAIQDLAIALAAMERVGDLDLPTIDL